MTRERVSEIIGFSALGAIALGASLYALNLPQTRLVYGVLAAGGLLLLAYIVMNIRLIADFASKRSARHGANMIFMIILFTTIVVVAQAMSVRHSYRYDLTRNKRFSLSLQTSNVLATLRDDVHAYAFYKQSAPDREAARDLLDQYAHASDRFTYEMIDPDQKPQRVEELGVTNYGTTVIRSSTKTDFLASLSEEKLTNSLLKVTSDITKVVYFVQGHGEKDIEDTESFGLSIMRDAVQRENYLVRGLSLFDERMIPEDAYVLVVAGPKHDYFEAEITKIEAYLMQGKNAVFLMEPRVDLPNIEKLLRSYKIILDQTVVVDPYSRVFGGDYTVPVVTKHEDHPITADISIATFYPVARSITISADDIPGASAQYLAKTGKEAWGETDMDGVKRGTASKDDQDKKAPVPIAAIATRLYEDGVPSASGSDESSIVVFGDSDFIDNRSFRISGNGDLFLNVINFLAEEKDLIAIRPKTGLGDQLFLTASQGRLIFLLSVVLMPLSVIGFGASVFIKRRREG